MDMVINYAAVIATKTIPEVRYYVKHIREMCKTKLLEIVSPQTADRMRKIADYATTVITLRNSVIGLRKKGIKDLGSQFVSI